MRIQPSTPHNRPAPARALLRRGPAAWLLLAVILAAGGGASCRSVAEQYTLPAGTGLPPSPLLADVAGLINENSSRVYSLSTTDASIAVPLLPDLQASIALERPLRFRLQAQTSFTGPEVDLGSNEELFWFWIRRNQPPAVCFCRHDRLAASQIHAQMPVEPEFLVEALGLAWIDLAGQHEGPLRTADGRLQVRSLRQSPQGPQTKITVIEPSRGWVLEQHLFDAAGKRIASAITSDHQHDLLHQVTLPRQIEIQWPAADATMKLQVRSWQINTLDGGPSPLWTMPEYPGYPPVDLGR